MSENEEKVGFVALGTSSWWSAPTPREQYLEDRLTQAEAGLRRHKDACKYLGQKISEIYAQWKEAEAEAEETLHAILRVLRQRNEAQAALKEEKALFASYVEMHNAAKQDWWDEREKLEAALKRLREGVERIANAERVLAQKDRDFAKQARIDHDQMIHLGRAQTREAISKELYDALADGERGEG